MGAGRQQILPIIGRACLKFDMEISLAQTVVVQIATVSSSEYSDTSANEDNSFRDNIR